MIFPREGSCENVFLHGSNKTSLGAAHATDGREGTNRCIDPDNPELQSEAIEEEGCEIDSDVESYIRMLIYELRPAPGRSGPNLKLGTIYIFISYEFAIFTIQDQFPEAPDPTDLRTSARFELQFFNAKNVIEVSDQIRF
jgi:hypothetical protein